MKNCIITIIFAIMLLVCLSCESNKDFSLPSFDGITVNENTIFIANTNNCEYCVVYAVDTKKNKIIYSYDFGKDNIVAYNVAYKPSFGNKAYFILGNKLVLLTIDTGKMQEIDISYVPEQFKFYEDKLLVGDSRYGMKGNSRDYWLYDPSKNAVEYITFPEGTFYGYKMNLSDNHYTVLFVGSEKYSEFYNITTGKIFEKNILDNKEYWLLLVGLNNYVSAFPYPDESDSNWRRKKDVYYIESLEPLKYKKILSDNLGFKELYENKKNLYFININPLNIAMYSKDGYILQKEADFKDSWFGTQCVDGYIWAVSEGNDGVYKINMNTLDYELIK